MLLVYYAPSVKNPNSNIHKIITCRPQVLSGRAIDANMEPLQEDVSNTTPIEFSSRSLFVDFSIYEMEDEQEQQNEVESEEDEENEGEGRYARHAVHGRYGTPQDAVLSVVRYNIQRKVVKLWQSRFV